MNTAPVSSHLLFSELDFAGCCFICSESKRLVRIETTVLCGAKQTLTCHKGAPSTLCSPAVRFH
jgi:hypothetical protein